MLVYHVRLSTVASVMNVSHSWLRHLIHEMVVDGIRKNGDSSSRSPFVVHKRQLAQIVIARELRDARVGYDTIRTVVDEFDFDKRYQQEISISDCVELVVDRNKVLQKAQRLLDSCHSLEYPALVKSAA